MDIPGYAEALAWEERTREEAFLGLCAPIRGVPVIPLTLRRLTFLLQARSAFLFGREPAPADACLFLWVVSPRFRPGNRRAQALWLAKLVRGSALDGCALDDLPALVADIGDYLDAAFNDAPAKQEDAASQGSVPYTSFPAALVDAVVSEYQGWRLDDVLDAPLACLYQLLRRIARRRDPKAVFISRRSIKARGDWLRACQDQDQDQDQAVPTPEPPQS